MTMLSILEEVLEVSPYEKRVNQQKLNVETFQTAIVGTEELYCVLRCYFIFVSLLSPS